MAPSSRGSVTATCSGCGEYLLLTHLAMHLARAVRDSLVDDDPFAGERAARDTFVNEYVLVR